MLENPTRPGDKNIIYMFILNTTSSNLYSKKASNLQTIINLHHFEPNCLKFKYGTNLQSTFKYTLPPLFYYSHKLKTNLHAKETMKAEFKYSNYLNI